MMRKKGWVQDAFFLIVPKPLEDELLSSWLARMAMEHKRSYTTFLSLFLKCDGSALSRTDIDFLYDEKLFYYLASKSHLDKKQILNMSLRSQEGYLYNCNDCLYPPKQIRKLKDKRTHFGLMYCPYCLAQDKKPYFRKQWRYSFYNVCTKHKVFLTDRCWKCYKPINIKKTGDYKELCFCNSCGFDLRKTVTMPVDENLLYGLKATQCFEEGFKKGYFSINKEKVSSLAFFETTTILLWLLSQQKDLKLRNFSMLDRYKTICKQQQRYASKKTQLIQKDFYLHSMVYHLFQDFPNNFLAFTNDNNLKHRDLTHSFNYVPFWYKEMVNKLIPPKNTIGREITETEVRNAIKYLQKRGIKVTQESVASVLDCHFSIHKGFVEIYKYYK